MSVPFIFKTIEFRNLMSFGNQMQVIDPAALVKLYEELS